MIRQLLGQSKKRKELKDQRGSNTQVESLTIKLKNISKNRPTLDKESLKFSVKLMQSLNSTSLPPDIQKQQFDASIKKKIKWNCSANSWTRETSPSHSIPQAKRFSQIRKQIPEYYPELSLNIRKELDKTGVSFTKQARKQLFKRLQQTPSPDSYKIKRYLQRKNSSIRSYISYKVNEQDEEGPHIVGGSIGKFSRYQNLYYPHTKKLNYNEKIIQQERQSARKRYKKFSFQSKFVSM